MKALLLPLITLGILFSYANAKWDKSEEVASDTREGSDDKGTGLPVELIRLPLRVHLITNFELNKRDVRMGVWVTADDVQKSLLPEVNRIWKEAGIEWVLESVVSQGVASVPDHEQAVADILNARRDMVGKEAGKRMKRLRALCAVENRSPEMYHLYLVPYLGQTFQGIAKLSGNFSVVGVWTDKPSKGKLPPRKSLLVEKGPFQIGSIARTISHELGHNLGLIHPDKLKQKHFSRLMGGRKPGNGLIAKEVAVARKHALARVQKIKALKDKRM